MAGRLGRRGVLKGSAAVGGVAAGSGAVAGFPTIWAQNIRDVVLRHVGPPVTAIPAIGEQATKDLGFTVQTQATENADLLNRILSQPSGTDCRYISITYLQYLVGQEAVTEIRDPFGNLMETPADLRDGGSFEQPMGNVAVWNAVMNEDRYLTRRWNEFITS